MKVPDSPGILSVRLLRKGKARMGGRNEEEQRLIKRMVDRGQGHLFRFWEELGMGERDLLMRDIRRVLVISSVKI